MVVMYYEEVPNRSSPPAVLIRESYREDGKVKKRTLSNISKLPRPVQLAIKKLLKGGTVIEDLSKAFEIVENQPWGHVKAALGTARKLGLERLLAPKASDECRRVLAMIVARVLAPGSKLATARGLGEEAHLAALRRELDLDSVTPDQLYHALDWLQRQQPAIEKRLADKHLENGCLVLYDVTSTYFEGSCCPLATFGYNRDRKKGKRQVVFGLLCNREGCPVAVEVFDGNTQDTKTLKPQIEKVRERFGLERVVFVGDRGMLTSARIRQDCQGVEGLDWISALVKADLAKLEASPGFQYSLFDERNRVEITDRELFPGERMIVCRNPLRVDEEGRQRERLLAATEKELDKVVRATQRAKNALRGKDKIGLRVGRVLNRYKVGRLFELEITETRFSYRRKEEKLAAEAKLDGLYAIRTSLPASEMDSEEVVRSYKRLSRVEKAFRSAKTVDLRVRPIYHYLPERVRGHIFLCMLAYYLEWHMRRRLAPLLYDDEDPEGAEAARESVVAPARVSASAREKTHTHRTVDDLPVHSFRTLLRELATLDRSRVQPLFADSETFEKLASPNALQTKAFSLLGLRP